MMRIFLLSLLSVFGMICSAAKPMESLSINTM